MTIYSEFQPTYLYIKEHRITGMRYLGKTTKADPDAYLGSGTYWRRHLRKYGKEHVVTVWKQLFTNREELIRTATQLSEEHDVANSEGWANLNPENGLDGVPCGITFSEEHKSKISKALRGREFSSEHRASLSSRLRGNPKLIGKSRPDVAERNRRAAAARRAAQSGQPNPTT